MGKSVLTPAERDALYRIFADYRAYKEAIVSKTVPSARGFANRIHPDLIHGTRVHPGSPTSVTGICVTPGYSEEAYRRYIWRIDWHVKQLPPYRRNIIRKRFLGRGKPPTDKQVHDELRKEGWYVSKSYFDSEKQEGLKELFRSLKAHGDAENDEKSVRKNVRKIGSKSSDFRTKM